MKSDENYFRIVPQKETRCVWMTAGVLSYQLCDRNFECDTCPLDMALRREGGKQHLNRTHSDIRLREISSACRLSPDLLYSSSHYWIRTMHDQYLRVGFEPMFADVLHSLRGIVLPSCGQPIASGRPAGWILFSHGTLPVFSPVDGRIIATNTTLMSNPQLMSKSPLDDGWIFELIPESKKHYKENLLSAEKADLKYKKDMRSFHDKLTGLMQENAEFVGPTLMDGGMPLDNISEIIGPEKYLDIVKSVFIQLK